MRLVRELSPSRERDVFYDVGCGYGHLCFWISERVKLSVGVENFEPRFKRAETRVRKSKARNVKILKKDMMRVSYEDATIIHSVIAFGFGMFKKIERETSPGTIVALCYCPPFPIKAKRSAGYFLMKTPFLRVRDEEEYARIFTGRKRATIQDVLDSLSRHDAKHLKWELKHAESNWRKLKGNSRQKKEAAALPS